MIMMMMIHSFIHSFFLFFLSFFLSFVFSFVHLGCSVTGSKPVNYRNLKIYTIRSLKLLQSATLLLGTRRLEKKQIAVRCCTDQQTITIRLKVNALLCEQQQRNREVAGSTHTQSTASNLQQVANLLCAQANSASYPQQDEKWVVATATEWRPSVTDWGDGTLWITKRNDVVKANI